MKKVKTKNTKLCVNNTILNRVQVMTKFEYEQLKLQLMNKVVTELRQGIRDSSYIYLCAYTYKNKYGKCARIVDEKHTKKSLEEKLKDLQYNYKDLRYVTINGEFYNEETINN